MKYYFTYGSGGCGDYSGYKQPYIGGWTVVHAKDGYEVIEKFNNIHAKDDDGFVNCSFIYTEEALLKTSMYKNGNFGKFEQEEIR